MIKYLPVNLQAKFWAWRCKTKIEAIRNLRASAKLPLSTAKAWQDPLWKPDFMTTSREKCPTCGRNLQK